MNKPKAITTTTPNKFNQTADDALVEASANAYNAPTSAASAVVGSPTSCSLDRSSTRPGVKSAGARPRWAARGSVYVDVGLRWGVTGGGDSGLTGRMNGMCVCFNMDVRTYRRRAGRPTGLAAGGGAGAAGVPSLERLLRRHMTRRRQRRGAGVCVVGVGVRRWRVWAATAATAADRGRRRGAALAYVGEWVGG